MYLPPAKFCKVMSSFFSFDSTLFECCNEKTQTNNKNKNIEFETQIHIISLTTIIWEMIYWKFWKSYVVSETEFRVRMSAFKLILSNISIKVATPSNFDFFWKKRFLAYFIGNFPCFKNWRQTIKTITNEFECFDVKPLHCNFSSFHKQKTTRVVLHFFY